MLEDHPDFPPRGAQFAGGHLHQVPPVDADDARIGALQQVDAAHQRRFARAGKADDAVNVAVRNREAYAADGRDYFAGRAERLAHICQFNQARHLFPLVRPAPPQCVCELPRHACKRLPHVLQPDPCLSWLLLYIAGCVLSNTRSICRDIGTAYNGSRSVGLLKNGKKIPPRYAAGRRRDACRLGLSHAALLFIFGFRRAGFFPRKAVCKEWAYRDGEAQMRGLSASASAQAARYAFAFSMYSMPIRLSV